VPDAVAGAGTIRSAADAQASALAGAKFGVSPGYTRAVGKACHDLGLPLLPGVATGSEIMTAQEDGYTQLKFFPALQAGGLPMLKAWQGPFGDVTFCPTGGIHAGNAAEFLALSNVACVGGSWIVPTDAIRDGDWARIEQLARARANCRADMRADFDASDLKVIAFDIFGTVVDWHSGIAAESSASAGRRWRAFALAWRAGYQPAMKAVMERIAAGEGGFTLLDELHLSMLEQVLRDFSLGDRLDSAAKRDLSRAWHRCRPGPIRWRGSRGSRRSSPSARSPTATSAC
jgi:Entner-Doudoroff aldolase